MLIEAHRNCSDITGACEGMKWVLCVYEHTIFTWSTFSVFQCSALMGSHCYMYLEKRIHEQIRKMFDTYLDQINQ